MSVGAMRSPIVKSTPSGPVTSRSRNAPGSSPDTRRERFHGSLSVFPQSYLDDILTGAHGQLALVARDTCHPQNFGKVFGLASAAPVGPGTAEFAVWVDDSWQGHGVGTLLVRAILHLLAQQGMSTAVAIMELGNGAIRRLVGRVARANASVRSVGLFRRETSAPVPNGA